MLKINALHIGRKIDGIGRFSLYIARTFIDKQILIINEQALTYFRPKKKELVRIKPKFLSPEYGRKSHLLRFIYSNFIKGKVLNLFQLEVSLWNKNQIVVVHDLIPLLFPREHKYQYFYYKYILPRILRQRCALIISVSHHTAELLKNIYNIPESKIRIIHNGIEIPNPSRISKEKFFLYVGRNGPNKNITNLIKGFKVFNSYCRNYKLYLAGCKIRKEKNIIPLGYISDKLLEKLYRKATALVFPSLYEGFGYPVLEAMARNTAVIASNTSSIPEVAGNAALYINNPKDYHEIAYRMASIAKNENLRKNLEIKGRLQAEKFPIEKTIEKYQQLIEEFTCRET